MLARRGLERDGYVLFFSRISPEKGVEDLIEGYERSCARDVVRLVIAGTGPSLADARSRAARTSVSDRIVFLDDVDDAEKWSIMAGCATFVLPSRPVPEFVETFGIALVEKMLAGGGPIITTATGGILEAVGDTAGIIPVACPEAIAAGIDEAVLDLREEERRAIAEKARQFALQFDRLRVFDRLVESISPSPYLAAS